MLLGCRVVRGPDWKWEEQDGGEGSVGTIVSLEKFADGQQLPPKTLLVYWDTGFQANYRAGINGCYDLRVYDSSSAGVVFSAFICDGCMHSGITGIHWRCSVCDDFDLCNVCYMNDVHDKDHAFVRYHISNDRANGENVGKRSAAVGKIRSKGIFPGAKVKRGRDWTLDNALGLLPGSVIGVTTWNGTPRSAVLVNWIIANETSHRLGFEGKVDLCLVEAANGPFYYKDHLPVVSMPDKERIASTGGEELRKGDMVKIELDVETLKLMAEGHGGWAPGMEKAIGKVGRVLQIDNDGDVYVQYGLLKWYFHPETLCKVTTPDLQDLRVGDKVKVINNKETVMKLQEGHGGWNNSMEHTLGKIGKVIRVVEDGDVVVNIESRVWVFNPNALMLESKEEERLPAGEGVNVSNESSTATAELLIHAMLEELMSNFGASSSGNFDNLLISATVGDLAGVKRIIGKNKALVNKKFQDNKTPLLVACHQGKGEVVSYLLENGADKDARDEEGYTPLHHAAYGDKSGLCVVLMLSANANVNATDLDRTMVTPLHLAVQRGNEAPATALIQSKHCNVNCQDLLGDTPLHEAILRGQDNIFTKLLGARNMDPTICNGNGFNILHLASHKNNQHAAKLLIEKFPGLVDISKEDGFSALHIAATNNHHEIARNLILSGHCAINMRNQEGMTALALSVTSSNTEMIELLIEHGVDINAEDKDGDTPLHVAVMKHCIAFIGLDLRSLGLNRQTSDKDNDSIEKAIAIFLVKRGADINYTNHQGKTPLDLCIDKDLDGMLKRQHSIRRNALPVSSCVRAPSPRTTGPFATTPPAPHRTPPTSPGFSTVPVKPVSPQPVTKPATKMPCVSKPLPPTYPPSTPNVPPFLVRGTETLPRPTYLRNMSALPMPATSTSRIETTSGSDIPISLSNVTQGSERRDPNLDIASEIKTSDKKTKSVESQKSNEQEEQCHYCIEEIAVVIFKPCDHKVVCEGCSERAKICIQCSAKISNKIVPGGTLCKPSRDVKQDYENKIKELQKHNEEMERIAICQICMDLASNMVFRPCGHRSCEGCSKKLIKCHNCNTKIEERIVSYQ